MALAGQAPTGQVKSGRVAAGQDHVGVGREIGDQPFQDRLSRGGQQRVGVVDDDSERPHSSFQRSGRLVDRVPARGHGRFDLADGALEVAQEAVSNAADVKKRVDQLKKDGKKSVLLLVSNGSGELRFVALAVK